MKIKKVRGKLWFIIAGTKRLGSKTEPYYKTEKEMLEEKTYTYDSLSPSEKKIYNESRNNE